MNNIEKLSRILQSLILMLKDKLPELTDEKSVQVADLFPDWNKKIGEQLTVGTRLRYDGSLFKVAQAHTAQADWTPKSAPSLYVNISDELTPEAGTQDNPIVWDSGMVAYQGKYYIEEGKTYRCTRDSGNPLHFAISVLIGHYFEVA